MSDLENVYKSPETPIIPEPVQNSGFTLTETMLRYLNEASPWLRFIGILGYIGCGFIIILGIIFAATGAFVSSLLGDNFGFFPAWIFAVIYIPMGLLLFFPSYYIYSFGKKIRNFRFSNSPEDLEQAFKNNKSLWKFCGIISIINLAFIPAIIVVAIILGVAALLGG